MPGTELGVGYLSSESGNSELLTKLFLAIHEYERYQKMVINVNTVPMGFINLSLDSLNSIYL